MQLLYVCSTKEKALSQIVRPYEVTKFTDILYQVVREDGKRYFLTQMILDPKPPLD